MRRVSRRIGALALLAGFWAFSASDAAAQQPARYCAVSGGHEMSYEMCAFATHADCMAELRGMGGYCRPNAAYVWPEQAAREQRAPRPAPR